MLQEKVELHNGDWADAENAVELHNGEFALLDDAVELHDGEFALKGSEDIVELEDGQFALMDDAVYLEGEDVFILSDEAVLDYQGVWQREADCEELFGKYFNSNDEDIHTTECGDRFHESQMNQLDIIWAVCDDKYAYNNNCSYGIINGRGDYGHWITDNHDEVYIQGEYFISDRIAELNGFLYDNDNDEWVSEDEYNSRRDTLASYHSLSRVDKRVKKEGWSFGIEVEKEDEAVRNEISSMDLYNRTGWCKERDGSLNNDSGFEAVSPVYGLHEKVWEEDFNDTYIKNILNADGTSDCGGHFNLSSSEFSPTQIANGLSAFFPLLYAMWEKRVKNSYCAGRKKNEMLTNNSKRSAVHIHSNRVEFRIFGRVKNVENAKFRIALVKLMVANINKSESQVLAMLLNTKSALHKLLLKVYTTEEIQSKIAKYVIYSEEYNDIKLRCDNKFTSYAEEGEEDNV